MTESKKKLISWFFFARINSFKLLNFNAKQLVNLQLNVPESLANSCQVFAPADVLQQITDYQQHYC